LNETLRVSFACGHCRYGRGWSVPAHSPPAHLLIPRSIENPAREELLVLRAKTVPDLTVFIRRCARDEIQLVGSKRGVERDAPGPSNEPDEAIHCIVAVLGLDWRTSGQRTMREGSKSEMSGGVQSLPFSQVAPVFEMHMVS
jgi:hypothetical protein